jgi:hypothetical protein
VFFGNRQKRMDGSVGLLLFGSSAEEEENRLIFGARV